jgi:hypothetical protein
MNIITAVLNAVRNMIDKPDDDTRTEYIVNMYRQHKHVDMDVIKTLQKATHKAHAKAIHSPTQENWTAYSELQKDYNNARAYYVRFGG